ncbi:MAG: Nif3-like dinuclear metal center hexameric protein [Planctomycetaceae bacterium]
MRIAEIIAFLRSFAPPALAEDWDNVGLLVGDAERETDCVMTCLTLTEAVAREAAGRNAGLIVSHHPLMFRPVQRVTSDTAEGRTVLALIESRIAVYSPHTSYDSASEGINRQLADALGLTDVRVLRPFVSEEECVLVCFVPPEHFEPLRDALWRAGAGQVGRYDQCSFVNAGTATFRGGPGSRPAVGSPGARETTGDLRLELPCPRRRLPAVIDALFAAHPYEEPAYNVYPLWQHDTRIGAGRYGRLPQPMSLGEFNRLVKERLQVERLQYVGDAAARVQRVGIACGSAADFMRDAHQRRCEVLLTGEARYHDCLAAEALGIALVLPGHHATERPAMERLAEILAAEFPALTVWPSQTERDPVRWD